MRLSDELRKSLRAAIIGHFLPADLELFTSDHQDVLGPTFEQVTFGVTGYDSSVARYITSLQSEGKIEELIKLLKALPAGERADFEAFFQRFDHFYELKNDEFGLREEHFVRHILDDTRPFIGRKAFRRELRNICNEKRRFLLNIKGPVPEMGISYLQYYLRSISTELGCFKFIYINANLEIYLKKKETKVVTAADLAELIFANLSVKDFTITGPLKITPFLTRLNEAMKVSGEKWLLYIDQLDKVPITEDALELIAAMPDNLDLRCQVLLGNLSDEQIKSWHWDVQQITYEHPLTNFTDANIDEFFTGAFSHMSKKYDFGITNEADFLAGYQQDIQAVKADLANVPNVTAVGRKVGSWFKKFNEDLIAAEE
ncbi:hypothetical protein [Mucilaginibacter sp. R-33]|uniref:hypothetical protein n=1 Tax=Mucilaginibacter sp. R-33 TaxID=3416711 RepID=UPI003CFB6EDD